MSTMPTTIRPTSSTLTAANRWDHVLARLGYRRGSRRTEPGLYALGTPGPDALVFVTANYRLSFDALRSALPGLAAYILVLDTDGINVWCAAGKGTFGTDELVRRIELTGLAQTVTHRKLILPQLGAAGVSAHEVRKRSGFAVEYGPVRAADLPEYLKTHSATPEMRRVRFDLRDRLVLIPVEAVQVLPIALAVAVVLGLLRGWLAAGAVLAAVLGGTVFFPILLPWLPTRDFSTKGAILGVVLAALFGVLDVGRISGIATWRAATWVLSYVALFAPVTAYLALNFTGATTFTSRTGVKREIAAHIPWMAAVLIGGIVLTIALSFL